ncbi:hypothetical protein ACJVC5_02640 [Peredibacter sp. HCB2-198]|uniref:hypothetical protein n=1 Tax=Peredibacter sp. HCB2-198 TaxID=3383025 RepID=UPI0038B65FFC
MKGFLVLATLLISQAASANVLREYKKECKSTVVTVDEVIKNEHIRGHITGLPADAYEKFKVVFYVKTNRWYVHPYTYTEGQEEGYSYSNLNANGEFWVRTLRRDVPSKELAVVLVPKNYRIVSQRWLLRPFLGIFGGITKNSCNYTIVPGNGDFFL